MSLVARLSNDSVFAGSYRVTRVLHAGSATGLYAAVEPAGAGAEQDTPVLLRLAPAAPLIAAAGGDSSEAAARLASAAVPPIEGAHFAQVRAAGIDAASGAAWVAYEPLTGELVAAALARIEMIHAADLTEIMGQLAAALAPVHARGAAHGALSPDALFLAAEPGGGTVAFTLKVLGFGLAACAERAWSAPEQLDEGAAGLTPGGDVWTLGLLVYQLLTGVSYWQGPGAASAPAEVDPRTAPLDPPSRRAAAHGLGAFLPPGFDEWFARCVARDPAARFATAPAAVAALLPPLAELAPPPARPPSRPPPPRASRPPPPPPSDTLDAEIATALREAGAVDDVERLSAAPPPPAPSAAREAVAIASEGESERVSHPSWPDPERRSEPTDISHRRSEPVIAIDPSPSKVPPEPVLPALTITERAAQVPPAPGAPRSHARLVAGVAMGLAAAFIVGVLVGRQYPAERDARRADALRLNGTDPAASLTADPPAVVPGALAPGMPAGGGAFGTPPGELPALPTPPVAPAVPDAGALVAPVAAAAASGAVSLSSGAGGSIYDNHTTSAQVSVAQRCTIASLEVSLRGNHTCPSDLIVRLRGPAGETATLQNHESRSPFRRFRVARFNGAQLEGRWTVSVTDDVGADSGNFGGFTLRATCQ